MLHITNGDIAATRMREGGLLDSRRPVTPTQFESAKRAWTAFRQPTPES